MTDQPEVVVYSRQGCHLCEQMIEELAPLVRGRAKLTVADVDQRAEWQDRYGLRVPVLEVGGRSVCEYFIDRQAVLDALAAAD